MYAMPVHFGADSNDARSRRHKSLTSTDERGEHQGSTPAVGGVMRAATSTSAISMSTGSSGAVPLGIKNSVGLSQGDSSSEPLLTPLFHIKSRDTCIMAMEHNAHFAVTALSLSTGEIVVVAMAPFAAVGGSGSGSGSGSSAESQPHRVSASRNKLSLHSGSYTDKVDSLEKSIAKQHTEWNPSTHSVTITTLPSPCLQLAWAPWRYGLMLVCVCPGKAVQIFRYALQQWSEEIVSEQVMFCNAVAFAPNGVLACGCNKGRIVFLRKDNEEFGQPWRAIFRTGDGSSAPANAGGGRTSVEDRDADRRKDIVSISWSDPGTMLAVGDQDSTVRVYDIGSKADTFQLKLVYSHNVDSRSGLRQLAWAPSSARSFLILAVAATDHFLILIFSTAAHASMREAPRQAAAFQAERLGSALYFCNGVSNPQRGVGSSSGSSCGTGTDELLKLCWNGSGMKLATTHADGSTRVYQVRVMYKETRAGGASANAKNPSVAAESAEPLIVDICEESRVSAPLCDDTVLLTVDQSA
jgi:hypothetical protein